MQVTKNNSRRFDVNTGPMVRPVVQEQRIESSIRGSGRMEKSLSGRIKLFVCRKESPVANVLEPPSLIGKSRHGRGAATAHHKPDPPASKEQAVMMSKLLDIEEVLSEPFSMTKATAQEPNYNNTKRRISSKTATSTSAASPDSPTKSASRSSSSDDDDNDNDDDDDDSTTEVIDEQLEQAYIELQKRVSEGPAFKPPEYILVPDLDNWRVEL